MCYVDDFDTNDLRNGTPGETGLQEKQDSWRIGAFRAVLRRRAGRPPRAAQNLGTSKTNRCTSCAWRFITTFLIVGKIIEFDIHYENISLGGKISRIQNYIENHETYLFPKICAKTIATILSLPRSKILNCSTSGAKVNGSTSQGTGTSPCFSTISVIAGIFTADKTTKDPDSKCFTRKYKSNIVRTDKQIKALLGALIKTFCTYYAARRLYKYFIFRLFSLAIAQTYSFHHNTRKKGQSELYFHSSLRRHYSKTLRESIMEVFLVFKFTLDEHAWLVEDPGIGLKWILFVYSIALNSRKSTYA
uniref:Uncharacterized protein n=1 Tax=Romanomermis culicivorax TaxID=13658 RepID=A0A915HQ80_ROMCU